MLPREHYLKQTFQDAINFPEGFEKGGLSDIQARLVRKQGALINALMMDEVADTTPEDLHILKVIANLSAPKSPAEQAWMKYQSIVKAKQAAAPSKTNKTRTTKSKAKPAAKPEEASASAKASADKPAKASSSKADAPKSSAKTKTSKAAASITEPPKPAKKSVKKAGEKA